MGAKKNDGTGNHKKINPTDDETIVWYQRSVINDNVGGRKR
jgi:hypothetical protein